MNIDLVIQQLRTYAPGFAGRVAGAAEFKPVPEATNMPVPAAYVVRLDDQPDALMAQNGVEQPLREGFAVIVALSNTLDERGQAGAENADSIRAQLWAALLGWQPTPDHRGTEYEGMFLLMRDRSRIWYQYEFGALMFIGPSDGWQQGHLAALPHFDGPSHPDPAGGANLPGIAVDVIDPIANPLPGPDGRIEFVVNPDTLP